MRRIGRSLAVAVATALLGAFAPAALPVHASEQPWGTPLVKGSDWAGRFSAMGDLNVYSNGNGNQDRMLAYGQSYECVELADRWEAVRYGEEIWWGVQNAYQIWDRGPTLKIPLNQLPNGGGHAPQFGDLIVFGPRPWGGSGHVAAGSGPR